MIFWIRMSMEKLPSVVGDEATYPLCGSAEKGYFSLRTVFWPRSTAIRPVR